MGTSGMHHCPNYNAKAARGRGKYSKLSLLLSFSLLILLPSHRLNSHKTEVEQKESDHPSLDEVLTTVYHSLVDGHWGYA